MPSVATYKANNPDWEYGDAYAIGTEAPYELYILTRADGDLHAEDYWFNIGEFPMPGPQGPRGFTGETGPQGPQGNPGSNGAAAGFGTVTASATTLEPNSSATVTVSTSGLDTAKDFTFTFGIPKGEPGEDGASEWGDITGDISDQTDLVSALQGKQNVLVSGTSIKTINNESLLGSGNITVAASSDWSDITNKPNFATVATSGSYTDLINKPSIPTKTSDLTNDSGFITSSALSGYATETWVGQQGYLTSVSWNDVSGKPTFATVATSGDYDDLTNKPDLSIYVESTDLAIVARTGDYNDLINLPTIPTDTGDLTNNAGFITSSALSGYATETWVGNQGYITGITSSDVTTALGYTPANSTTLGDYVTLATDQTISGVKTFSGDIHIPSGGMIVGYQGSNTLACITFDTYGIRLKRKQNVLSGAMPTYGIKVPDTSSYTANKTIATTDDIPTSMAWSDITGKPTFATVATSGDYGDLLNKPTIPAAQVNSDWNAVSGVAQILNKPTLASVATSGSYNDLTNKPTIYGSDTETWTFTLSDGTTMTKTIVVG